jgi:hypothetical protein
VAQWRYNAASTQPLRGKVTGVADLQSAPGRISSVNRKIIVLF